MRIEAYEALVEKLEAEASELTRQERIDECNRLIDVHMDVFGDKPKPDLLSRITDVILKDELSDMRKNKSKTEEFPFLSDSQYSRRTSGKSGNRSRTDRQLHREVSIDAAVNVSHDGIDHTPSQRKFNNAF